MSWGAIGKAVGAIGGKVVGDWVDRKTDRAGQQVQYDHLKQGIRWKVADAKKAGIHPLFALGASTGTPIVQSGSGLGDIASSAVGDAISSSIKSPAQKQAIKNAQAVHEANIREMNARADLIETQAKDAKLRLIEQSINRGGARSSPAALNPGEKPDVNLLGFPADPIVTEAREGEEVFGEVQMLNDIVNAYHTLWQGIHGKDGLYRPYMKKLSEAFRHKQKPIQTHKIPEYRGM